MGRLPKSAAQHKAEGTYRTTRHASRAEMAIRAGVPEMPTDLDEEGRRVWERITSELPAEVLSKLDTFALADMSRTWSLLCKYQKLVADDPLDDKTARLLNATQGIWLKYAARFGLSPTDRSRIKTPPQQDDQIDPIAAVLKLSAG
jgi:phage terminase small subunit